MKIAVDIQALQTKYSPNRGIGRYTTAVLESLQEYSDRHDFLLFANSTLPEPLLDTKRFKFRYIEYPTSGSSIANELIMKSFLLSQDIDAVFVPSPMENLDAVIPEFNSFPRDIYAIAYDLIPMVFPERYLNGDEVLRTMYFERLRNLTHADHLFAISEATKQDIMSYLQVSGDKITNVSGGVSEFFSPVAASEKAYWKQIFDSKFRINKKFVLYTGGEDWRKNIEGLITAFSQMNAVVRNQHLLVIACRLTEPAAANLMALARKLKIEESLILTNYVSNEELRALYSFCSLFVFPSYYEGFGLPLLEAMACGAPSITANNSSLIEIAGANTPLFNAAIPADICRHMEEILQSEKLQKQLSLQSLRQAEEFTWTRVAARMVMAFDKFKERKQPTFNFSRLSMSSKKPRIAFYSPFRPIRSGISDYSEDLLPALLSHFDCSLYHDSDFTPASDLPASAFPAELLMSDSTHQNHSAILYQMGNSSYHCEIYSLLQRYSGITVLHDYALGGLINYLSCTRPELGISLKRELNHCYPPDQALRVLSEMQSGSLKLEHLPEAGIYLNKRVFTRSLGIILHSQWAFKKAINEFGEINEFITHIPMMIPKTNQTLPDAALLRQQLNLPEDGLIFASFGFVAGTKRPFQILEAFSEYIKVQPQAFLLFVGSTEFMNKSLLDNAINKYNLQDNVRVTGYISMEEFYQYTLASDICLNLRFPSNGESSASLLRIMSRGKPTIVTDIDSFADFPNDVVHKVLPPTKGDEVKSILEAMIVLSNNYEYRRTLGRNAKSLVAREHSPERCAALYADFIRSTLKSPASMKKQLADFCGREMALVNQKSTIAQMHFLAKAVGASI